MAIYKDEKRGTWYCKFYYVDWTGTRRQKLKRGFKLQREAKEWERLFLEQFAKNPYITFESLYEKYLKFKENRIRPTTLANQRNAIELHILPHFKDKIVSEITPADIVEWQNIILAKGFTPSHTRLINTFLKMIFKYAVDYLGLSQSPVKSQICKSEKGKIDFWTPEEYKMFSDHIRNKIELFTAFEILFYTGMRKGELMALTLGDIDFDQKTISVNKTLVCISGNYSTQPPKTRKGNRVIDVPDFLLDEIRAYISKLYKPDSEHRLFTRSLAWLGEDIDRTCSKIDLKPIRVHDIRHSHASMLIDLGANPLMIAERLGHEDVKMTMNTYSHLFKSHQKEIIEKLEKIKLYYHYSIMKRERLPFYKVSALFGCVK